MEYILVYGRDGRRLSDRLARGQAGPAASCTAAETIAVALQRFFAAAPAPSEGGMTVHPSEVCRLYQFSMMIPIESVRL